MRITNLFKSLTLVAILGVTAIYLQSCAEATKGCSDSAAENYDATVDETDNTLCIFPRDKFVGNYKGTLICAGPLQAAINNPVYDYSITEAAGGTVDAVTLNVTVFSAPTKLAGKISGNTLTIDQVIPNVPFTLPTGTATTANIKATGSATLGTDNKTLTGTVNLVFTQAATGSPLVSDNCPITGTKQ